MRIAVGPDGGQRALTVGRAWQVVAIDASGLVLRYGSSTACGVSPEHVARLPKRSR